MLKYLRLNQCFDAASMQEECVRLEAGNWQLHYNEANYSGNWTVLPLRAMGGKPEHLFALHSNGLQASQSFEDTPLLAQCPYIKTLLDSICCEKTAVRLMKLHAGAAIKPHQDYALSFEEGEARLHIPVFTNPQVEFFVQQERVMMNEGECWYLNLSLTHHVKNLGMTDRVHLVVDCIVNDWLTSEFANPELFQKHISDAENAAEHTKEEQLKIIEELKKMNTATSLSMAEKMEREL